MSRNRCFVVALLLTGAVNVTAAQTALSLDGLDDRVTLPTSGPRLATPRDGTFEAWVRVRRDGTFYSEGHWDGPNLLVGASSGRASFWMTEGPYRPWHGTEAGELPAGEWAHVAATFTDATITLYLNGVRVGEVANAPRVTGPYDMAFLGCGLGVRSGPQAFLDGDLDEVRLWSRALSLEEIRRAMVARPALSDADLLSVWAMDEGTGSVARDLSLSQNHGTLGPGAGLEPRWFAVDRADHLPWLLRSGSSRLGGTLSLVSVGRTGTTWLLFLGLAESQLQVPPFGVLRIAGYPAAVWLMDAGFIQAGSVLDVTEVVTPNHPELVGAVLYWQGLSLDLFGLSGALTDPVRVSLRN